MELKVDKLAYVFHVSILTIKNYICPVGMTITTLLLLILYFSAAPSEANIHAALRHIFPLVLPFQLAKEKLNPREYELTVKYLASSTTSASKKAGVMEKYQHFRYVKRAEEEDSYDDESSYGEDSDSN